MATDPKVVEEAVLAVPGLLLAILRNDLAAQAHLVDGWTREHYAVALGFVLKSVVTDLTTLGPAFGIDPEERLQEFAYLIQGMLR